MSIVKQLVQRADSWVNAMTGLGTLRDKLTHAQVVPGAKLDDHTLEALFNDDDVARRIVTKLPRDATRRGFRIELEGDDEGDADEAESADVEREMLDRFQKLDAMPKLRDGWIWARLYGGGSGVFVGADDGQSVDQPLNETSIRTIRFLNVLKRPQLTIKQRYLDVQQPKFGQPEIYTVNQAAVAHAQREGLDVHESRLILFDGALTAQLTMQSPTGFDDSVLQACMASLQQTATAWQSVAHLMTDASQGVLKIANLVDLIAAGGEETLRSRVQLMDMARSVCRSILVDAERESFERVATSFAGLPEVLDKLMMRQSASAEQPVTLLYGRSPAGLNATGESDIRGWYDTVAEGQTDEFKPRLERLLRLMFAAKDSPTRGRVPENWCIEFNPLWQPTDKELADTKKVKADTYVALVGAQIMTDAEAGLGLAPDFPTIDVESRAELAAADADEGLRPREVNAPPPPEPANDNGEPGGGDDAEGGSSGTGPKGRSDSGQPRDDAQPRVPAGSSEGGRFASAGGGSGAAGAAKALGAATGGALADVPGREAVRAAMPGVEKATKYREAAEAELRQNPDNVAAWKVTARGLAADAVKVNAGKAASEEALTWAERWSSKAYQGHAAAMANEAHAALRTPGSSAQAHYAATQAIIEKHVLPRLRAEGKVDADGNVTLYRGLRDKQAASVFEASQRGGPVELQVHKLSSWSESAAVARSFGTVVEAKVHYSRAFITHHAQGRTWADEQEWAILSDGKESVKVHGR